MEASNKDGATSTANTSSLRKVPMKVLSLGYSRTGTATMQAALQQLGYFRTYHSWDIIDFPESNREFEKILDAKIQGRNPTRQDLDRVFCACQAVTDQASVVFAEDFVREYPEAKVVLVERDIDKWFESMKVPLSEVCSWSSVLIMKFIEPLLGLRGIKLVRKLANFQFRADTLPGMHANAKAVYREHYKRVREIVPAERLLEFDLKSGWAPLCEFLGDRVPDGPFPWVNETAALRIKAASIRKAIVISALSGIAKIAVMGMALAWCYERMPSISLG